MVRWNLRSNHNFLTFDISLCSFTCCLRCCCWSASALPVTCILSLFYFVSIIRRRVLFSCMFSPVSLGVSVMMELFPSCLLFYLLVCATPPWEKEREANQHSSLVWEIIQTGLGPFNQTDFLGANMFTVLPIIGQYNLTKTFIVRFLKVFRKRKKKDFFFVYVRILQSSDLWYVTEDDSDT